jgi:hypothetical protein
VSVETVAAVNARRDGLLVRRVGAGVRFDNANAPMVSPEASRGSHCFCCASLPARAMTSATSEFWTARMTATVALPRAMASIVSA